MRLVQYTQILGAATAVLIGVSLAPGVAEAQPASPGLATPTVSVGLDPSTLDYGHQSIVVSGSVINPTTSGADVSISYLNAAGQATDIDATTNADGSYSATISDLETAAQTITATVAATSTTATASASANLGFTQDQVVISAKFAHPNVNNGGSDALSGLVEYVSDGTALPLSGATVTISWPNYPVGESSATVTTSSDGAYSYSPPSTAFGAGESYTFAVATAATAYLEAAQANATVIVNEPPQVADFAGTLSSSRVLKFDACGGIPGALANAPLFAPLEYQYSKSPDGPWKTLGAGKADDTGSCFSGGDTTGDANYPAQFKAPLPNAYYRAYAPAVPGQESAASPAIHLWKHETRITNFKISPRKVKRDGVITVSGRLSELTRRWVAVAHGKITIEYRYGGKTYLLRQLTTNSAGDFRGKFRVPHSAPWLAVFPGGATQFEASTRPIRVRVYSSRRH